MLSRKIKLGSMYGVPQFRFYHWRLETRNKKTKVYLKVNYACSDEVWDIIVKCALSTASAVGVATIISGGAAVVPAFLAVFLPNLAAQGIMLTANKIYIYTKTSHSNWHRA